MTSGTSPAPGPLRIGVIASCFSDPRRTGIGRFTIAMMREFLRAPRGHRYIFYSALPMDPALRAEILASPHGEVREGTFPIRYLWQVTALRRRLMADKIDSLLSVDGILPVSCPVPAVCVVHDLIWWRRPETAAFHIRAIFRTFLRQSLLASRIVTADSEATARDVRAYLGAPGAQVNVVPLAADAAFNAQARERLDAVRAKHGLHRGYILYIGNIMPHKNVVGLLQAYADLRKAIAAKPGHGAPPALVLVGFGKKAEGAVLDAITRLGLQDHVILPGYVADEDLPAFYIGAELLVFPSLMEGFGIPILEAQGCGTPVACSNTSSLPEVAGDGAEYFDPENIASMTAALLRLCPPESAIEGPELDRQNQLIEAGYRNASRFSWAKTAAALQDLLEKAPVAPPIRERLK